MITKLVHGCVPWLVRGCREVRHGYSGARAHLTLPITFDKHLLPPSGPTSAPFKIFKMDLKFLKMYTECYKEHLNFDTMDLNFLKADLKFLKTDFKFLKTDLNFLKTI